MGGQDSQAKVHHHNLHKNVCSNCVITWILYDRLRFKCTSLWQKKSCSYEACNSLWWYHIRSLVNIFIQNLLDPSTAAMKMLHNQEFGIEWQVDVEYNIIVLCQESEHIYMWHHTAVWPFRNHETSCLPNSDNLNECTRRQRHSSLYAIHVIVRHSAHRVPRRT